MYNEKDYEDEYEVRRMVLQTQLVKAGTLSSYPIGVPEPKCYCPTLQMAMKWLREVHNLHIRSDRASKYWNYTIRKLRPFNTKDLSYNVDFNTYEQACEAAIKYCLENLI